MSSFDVDKAHFAAVKREFILKVDGARPILYSLDYINTVIYHLSPLEGLALSLLDGVTPVREAKSFFEALFPDAPVNYLDLVRAVDERVRLSPSQTGIGRDGLIEASDSPIAHAQSFDPRRFVINSQDYEAQAIDVKTSHRLNSPINIYPVFTHRCVTDCAYCYADRAKMDEMPLTRWREIFSEMRKLDIWLGAPDNGDTFARRDGVDLLECLLEHEIHFLLSTKAYVSKDDVARLVDAGLKKKVRGVIKRCVQLSVDAAQDDVSKRVLNLKKSMVKKHTETFLNFLAFGIMPKIKGVITGLNYDQPKPIVDLFYPLGARVFHFVKYHRSFHRHADELFVEPRHVPTLAKQFDKIRELYPDVDLVENLTGDAKEFPEAMRASDRQKWDSRIGCGGGWSSLGISPNGKAFLCEQMKMAEPFFVGDARVQSIEEIWQGQKMFDFIHPPRERFSGTECVDCEEFETCVWEKGRCYRDAYFSYGSIYHPPPLCPKNSRPGLRLS
ncbi:MAG: radical SAM family [Methylocystaceae bacterium]|nr:MAG: radical SAM family [Methylocystaceae bacterium]